MALSIVSRPEKTLDNGFLSRWNASATPLIYKLSSNAYPTNSISTEYNITNYVYNPAEGGIVITCSTNITEGSIGTYFQVNGTDGINGIHKIIGYP